MKNKINYEEFIPRTQAERYNHALLEQIIGINNKLDILISILKPSELSKQEEEVKDKPKSRKKKSE
jgi:hypothetical protein